MEYSNKFHEFYKYHLLHQTIHIHYIVKDQPVFVSDVTLSAIQPTLSALMNTQDNGFYLIIYIMYRFDMDGEYFTRS